MPSETCLRTRLRIGGQQVKKNLNCQMDVISTAEKDKIIPF